MKKKYTVILLITILGFCTVMAFWMGKKSKPDFTEEEYFCDGADPTQSYSENTVLYLDDAGILHLIDTGSGKDMVYCDRPNCVHEGYSRKNETPSCPAAFWGAGSVPVPFGGHLYFIGDMSEEDILTKFLYEMDTDGENRKKVATLNGVQSIRYVLYRDRYAIGAFSNRSEINEDGQIVNDDKPEAGIFVIDLSDYTVYMGDKVTGEQANITGLYYEDGAVYYSVIRFGDDITELMVEDGAENNSNSFSYNHMLYEIYKYDIKGKSTTRIKTFDHLSNLQLAEGSAYGECQEDYFVFDLKSGETKELPIDRNTKTASGRFAKQGDTLYYALLDSDREEVIYYCMKEEKINELMRMPSASAFGIVNICGSSVYINYTDEKGRFCLGVLSRDDYDEGVFQPRKLRYYNEEEEDTAGEDADTEEEAAEIITFTVPDICRIEENNLRHLNEALKEDGYSYRMQINYLEYETYTERLKEALKNGDTDIAFLGLDNEGNSNSVYTLIHSGLLLNLDEILSQENGAALYQAFPQALWEAVKCDRHIYSIPSVLANDEGVYAAFNRDYVADDEIEAWDGSIEGIYEIIKNTEWDKEDSPRFQYLISGYSFEDMIGCEIRNGLLFDYELLTVENPLESEKFTDYLKVLEQMKKDGFMTDSVSYLSNSDTNNTEVLQTVEEGNYMVALSYGAVDEAFQKDNVAVKKINPYLSSRINGSVGISRNCENLEDVVEFLKLFYEDGKYGNLLLYGQEDVDYKVTDGVACHMDGSALENAYLSKLCFNLFVNICPVEGENYVTNRKEEFFSFYDGIKMSPFIGFEPDTDGTDNIGKDMDEFMDSLTDKTVEEAVRRTGNKLASDGMEEYLSRVQSQWEEYRQ